MSAALVQAELVVQAQELLFAQAEDSLAQAKDVRAHLEPGLHWVARVQIAKEQEVAEAVVKAMAGFPARVAQEYSCSLARLLGAPYFDPIVF